ncbi:glycosyltransferase family A protein [Fibrobacter intestinalis]|uniref:Glycosyltransferase involved in cell wall bisynthesis n=1 Tax=Fibrobacter intestinalis TaxID=28122 RepID=A0A1T4K2W0_9BACT|nr:MULTISPECIES: glycosyltransferase family A protein [Fibrobacter]PBC74236.1 glycosyltransferase involved in cell wall bisynthesis [Fibrobacter sp. NR9]SJZ36665.1 Glycosyltransferase involved in cell wall bisynthesis [Fibrobacter intestinalis]
MSFITIFTPTYNRRHLIDNLYQSLLQQSEKNFEWLVVDDGSSDDTEQYFSGLLSKPQPFPIQYIKQENGGKHRAINRGVKKANGELFFIVDSDDYLIDKAIEKINQWIVMLDNSHKWAGVSGLKGYSEQKNVGQHPSTSFVDAKNTERRKFHLEGDKAEIYFTDVLRKYPFPEISGEKFISEEIVWNAIAREGYYLRWFNEIIYICSYLDGGLTKDSSKDERNPQGRLLWARGQLESFPDDWRKRFSAIAIYYNAVHKNKPISVIAKDLGVSFFYVIVAKSICNIFFLFYHLIQKKK